MTTTKLITKTQLDDVLAEFGFIDSISYETYGRKTFAYVTTADRSALAQHFDRHGLKFNRYYQGKNTVEVQISYFKAPGWDE